MGATAQAGDVAIRAARPDELAEVGRVTLDAYVADGYLGSDHPYAAHLLDARVRHEQAELLVAADQSGAVLGTVTVCLPGTPLAEISVPGELEFRMLAVAPAARGRGIGGLLTRTVLDRARARGDRRVVLSSLDRMRAAHRIYESMGFVRAPERDWRPEARAVLWAFVLELQY